MESEPENVDTVNEIFRAAHSLKGMAGTMGYKRMQRLTHDMENVFSEIRNGKMNVNADLVDIVFKCLDALEGYLTNIIETSDEGTEDNDELIAQLNAVLQNGLAGSGEAQAAATKEETKEEKKPEGGDRRNICLSHWLISRRMQSVRRRHRACMYMPQRYIFRKPVC